MIAAAESAIAPRCAQQRKAFKGMIIWPRLAGSLVGELVFMILNGEITDSGFATMSSNYMEMHDIEVTCVAPDSEFAHRSAPIRKEGRSRCCSQHHGNFTPRNRSHAGRMHLLCAWHCLVCRAMLFVWSSLSDGDPDYSLAQDDTSSELFIGRFQKPRPECPPIV
jgi:hypothetical protein